MGDKLFNISNPVNTGLQTSINIFFGGQRFESKNAVHIHVQTYMIIAFFLQDQDFDRPVTPFEGYCLSFHPDCTRHKKYLERLIISPEGVS